LLLVASAAGLLGAGGVAAAGVLLPFREAVAGVAARLRWQNQAAAESADADSEPGVPLSTGDLTQLAAERDRARRRLAELVARQGEADQMTRERMREMQARIAEAERRAEASERRLQAAAVERDDALDSLHRAALAAAVAASAALTGQVARGTTPSPLGPRVPAEE
jgi:hypothetical protein